MGRYTGQNARQKEFIKMFDTLLTGSYTRWQVWDDMIWMFATTIANTIPTPHWQKREDDYLKRIGKYKRQEQQVFPELFALLVQTMDESVNEGRYGDFLGELFMLMELGNDHGGQFFTPYDVCRMMAEVTFTDQVRAEIDRRGFIVCNDPAVGAGATMIAFAEILQQRGINYQQRCVFTGQDIDYIASLMAYIQLSLLGCAGYITIGNTLTAPDTSHPLFGSDEERMWKTPMFFATRWEMQRTIHQARGLVDSVATATGEAPALSPTSHMPEEASLPETPADALSGIFTVSTKKRNAGQIMMEI